MATPKLFPTDKPGTSSPRKPKSSASPRWSVTVSQDPLQNATAFGNFKVAFIGRTGSGRNSLAWRMNNLNEPELPDLPFLPCREVILDTATRPALQYVGTVGLQIRIVPPEELHGEQFFDRRGGINDYDVLVFVVDLGDDRSSNEFYTLHGKAKRRARSGLPPFLIVGNKADRRHLEVATPYTWGEETARLYKARGYLECSAKSNDRVGDVLDAILRIVL